MLGCVSVLPKEQDPLHISFCRGGFIKEHYLVLACSVGKQFSVSGMVPTTPGPPNAPFRPHHCKEKHMESSATLQEPRSQLGNPLEVPYGIWTENHPHVPITCPLAASSSSRCWVQSTNAAARQLATSSQSLFIPLSSSFCQREACDEVVNWHRGTYLHGRCSEMRVCQHLV